MSTNALTKKTNVLPSFVNDFFKPWNDWFDNGFERTLLVPAVNITENEKEYHISVAAPGMKKEDFKIDLHGNLLTISSEKETTTEETKKHFNRREYNYASFRRSFNLPDEVKADKIEAKYEDGILKLLLPKIGSSKPAKSIAVK